MLIIGLGLEAKFFGLGLGMFGLGLERSGLGRNHKAEVYI